MVIGKGGSEIEKLRNKLNTLTDKKVHINVIEIKKIDIDARLVADNTQKELFHFIHYVLTLIMHTLKPIQHMVN